MRMPSFFISHGAPDLAVRPTPAHLALKALARLVPKPKAILIASAHWPTESPAVATGSAPATIYDFGGFDPRLRTMRYRAPGAPEVSRKAAELMRRAGFEVSEDEERGYDHGVWTPLVLLYPEADVPVAQVSIQPHRDPAHHLAIGRALSPLREEGVMIIGSGAMTHNLRAYFTGPASGPPPAWVTEFTGWMKGRLEANDASALVGYRAGAPHAQMNHPEDEHLLPIFIPLGATLPGEPVRQIHASYDKGVLAMDIYAFGEGVEALKAA
ncbi:MAG: dioxygenase [Hyphomicrobiaceae bacterium]|nr:MAG: dioxygenase [Hyphomicrobiaceae bacterium]